MWPRPRAAGDEQETQDYNFSRIRNLPNLFGEVKGVRLVDIACHSFQYFVIGPATKEKEGESHY